jgi:MoaD family protein
VKIKVQYISLVKSFTNRSQDEFELREDSLLSELLDKIAETYGTPFTEEVYEKGQKEMKSTFVAMVNGVLISQLKGMDTQLKDGDNIILMSLMTGG